MSVNDFPRTQRSFGAQDVFITSYSILKLRDDRRSISTKIFQ